MSSTAHEFESDNDFLGLAPENLVTPNVAPAHEVSHWQHADSESPQEGLLSNEREKQVHRSGNCQPVLESFELILGNVFVLVF